MQSFGGIKTTINSMQLFIQQLMQYVNVKYVVFEGLVYLNEKPMRCACIA